MFEPWILGAEYRMSGFTSGSAETLGFFENNLKNI
jgi:hypothetical protein